MGNDSIYSLPDPCSLSPLIFLLPDLGSVNDLKQMTNAMFARYDKVKSAKKNLTSTENSSELKKLSCEELMLKDVLDWLSFEKQQ